MSTSTVPNLYTFYNPQYALSNILGVVTIKGIDYLDMLDPRIIKFINSVKNFQITVYDSSVPLTTLAYQIYGTTTLYWTILVFNGYFHELEIPVGAVLKLPNLNDFKDIFIPQVAAQRRGQTITV